MATYLPKDTSPGSAYQEGGGLYALGLIHANHGGDIIDYLLSQLKNASNDVSFFFLKGMLFCANLIRKQMSCFPFFFFKVRPLTVFLGGG